MDCQTLAEQAHAAGMQALQAAAPVPMVVVGAGAAYVVEEGVCGFAWVTCKGNTKFGRWAKAAGVARPSIMGGLRINVWEGGQSMARKEAYAQAYAATLRAAGVDAYAHSRMAGELPLAAALDVTGLLWVEAGALTFNDAMILTGLTAAEVADMVYGVMETEVGR